MFTAQNNRSRAGFTLVETMVATGLGCLVLVVVLWTGIFASRSFTAVGNYREMESQSRIALDKLSRDIRQVDGLTNYSSTFLGFQTTDPNSGVKYALTYTYNTNLLKLTRVYGTETNVLMTNCTYFHFDVFQRNPSLTNGGDLVALISTNQPGLVKAVDFTWICSVSNYGQIYNSQDVQSARVVIRKD
jgi:hypothetical protein